MEEFEHFVDTLCKIVVKHPDVLQQPEYKSFHSMIYFKYSESAEKKHPPSPVTDEVFQQFQPQTVQQFQQGVQQEASQQKEEKEESERDESDEEMPPGKYYDEDAMYTDMMSLYRSSSTKDDYTLLYQKFEDLSTTSSRILSLKAEIECKLEKWNEAIESSKCALDTNENSARALRAKGRAEYNLGDIGNAHASLLNAQSIDYSEDLCELCDEVGAAYKQSPPPKSTAKYSNVDGIPEFRLPPQSKLDQNTHQNSPTSNLPNLPMGGNFADAMKTISENPNIVNQMSNFCAQNPQLVQNMMKSLMPGSNS